MIAQRKIARGYFRSEKETSVLSSPWKSLKPTCVVPSLHNSAVTELSVEGRSSHAFVAVIFLGSPVQNVSQSEACTCHFIYFLFTFFACHFIELTTAFFSAMAFLNDSKLSLTSEQGFHSYWHSLGYSTKYYFVKKPSLEISFQVYWLEIKTSFVFFCLPEVINLQCTWNLCLWQLKHKVN